MDPETDASEMKSLRFAQLAALFVDEQYPTSTAELLAKFDDVRVQYPNTSEPLSTVLEGSGAETYETAEQLQLAILNGVSRDAVGRPRYSDRALDRDEYERTPDSF
ncbi:DUF5789 family protein [Haloferacaceae archaeon DSL9]